MTSVRALLENFKKNNGWKIAVFTTASQQTTGRVVDLADDFVTVRTLDFRWVYVPLSAIETIGESHG